MEKDNKIINTRNEIGKRKIQEVINKYSIEILKNIKQNPEILPYLLDNMELIEEEFEEILFSNQITNITIYYEMLSQIKNLTKYNYKVR